MLLGNFAFWAAKMTDATLIPSPGRGRGCGTAHYTTSSSSAGKILAADGVSAVVLTVVSQRHRRR